MSDRKSNKGSGKGSSKEQSKNTGIRDAGNAGLVSMKFKDALTEKGQEGAGTGTAIAGLIVSLVFIALQIYILYYTFKLERIGCECARDFRRTYAQVYIILSFAVYVALGIMEALTDENNMKMMSMAKAIMNGVMFIAGIVYVVFVWQYISKLRRIKCACSTSLARDIWEVVNYIQAAVLILSVLILIIAMLYSASIYQSMTSPFFPK